MTDKEKTILLKAQEQRLTEMHVRLMQLSDAAKEVLDVPFATAYLMTQLSHLGQDNVEKVLKGLVTVRAKLEGAT